MSDVMPEVPFSGPDRLPDATKLAVADMRIRRLETEVERLRSGALDQGEAGLLEVLAREEIARHKYPPHALLSAHEKLAARADRSDIPNGPRFDPSDEPEDSR